MDSTVELIPVGSGGLAFVGVGLIIGVPTGALVTLSTVAVVVVVRRRRTRP